jgi:hypothetical protein
MFPHRNIHKYTWESPDRKTHNQIGHILVDRRRHSNVLDVRSSKVAKVRDKRVVNKKRSHRFHMEKFNLRKLTRYRIKSNFVLRSQIGMQLWKLPYILESNPHLVFATLYCSYGTYTGSILWPNPCTRLRI